MPITSELRPDGIRVVTMDAPPVNALTVQAWRGTLKLAQTKPEPARLAAAEALEAQGRRAMAALMRGVK